VFQRTLVVAKKLLLNTRIALRYIAIILSDRKGSPLYRIELFKSPVPMFPAVHPEIND